jgi:hypothetical protein
LLGKRCFQYQLFDSASLIIWLAERIKKKDLARSLCRFGQHNPWSKSYW